MEIEPIHMGIAWSFEPLRQVVWQSSSGENHSDNLHCWYGIVDEPQTSIHSDGAWRNAANLELGGRDDDALRLKLVLLIISACCLITISVRGMIEKMFKQKRKFDCTWLHAEGLWDWLCPILQSYGSPLWLSFRCLYCHVSSYHSSSTVRKNPR